MWSMRSMRSALAVPISRLHTTQLRFSLSEQYTTTEETGRDRRVMKEMGKGDSVKVKLMFPYYTVGAIIGTGGEGIKQLRTEHNTWISNSRMKHYFPGTSEQVFYIQGAEDDVMEVVEKLSDTLRYKDPPEGVSWAVKRQNQMKLVLPETFCRKILADNGTIAKELKEAHGVGIHIEPKKVETGESERYMIITEEEGDRKKVLDAGKAVIRMLNEDPEIMVSKRLAYKQVYRPADNNEDRYS